MTSYNTVPPTPGRKPRFRTVEIGWRHTFDGDDMVVTADDDGNPIPTTYQIPLALTAKQLIAAVERVGQENLQRLANAGTMDATLELLGAVIGSDVILRIAEDPTVSADQFASFVADTIEALGLDEAVPPPEAGEPPVDPKA